MTSLQGKFAQAMQVLTEASAYAADVNSCRWEFAISIRRLELLGIHENDLRWLAKKGLVEHRREVVPCPNDGVGCDGRRFQSTGNSTFTQESCFVLTDSGAAFSESWGVENEVASEFNSLWNGSLRDGSLRDGSLWNGAAVHSRKPYWDLESRTLRLNSIIVKRFRWRAVNQEAVLCAFQEEGWPSRIDDPLPPDPELVTKRRLADTIKCLNRKQSKPLVHFRGDGTGEGIVWECAPDAMNA